MIFTSGLVQVCCSGWKCGGAHNNEHELIIYMYMYRSASMTSYLEKKKKYKLIYYASITQKAKLNLWTHSQRCWFWHYVVFIKEETK